jgi:hypothetical protein
MKIVAFDEVEASRWNDACDESADAWFFHRHAWVQIEARFWALANRSFAIVTPGGDVCGVLPLYVREHGLGEWTERVVDCGIHRHTGLALIGDLSPADVRAARRLAMSQVHHVAVTEGADRIQLNSQNLAPCNRSPEREDVPFWVLEDGYQLGLHFGPEGFLPVPGMVTSCVDQIVPLAGRTEAELFGALDEACRRAVRKAVGNGLRVVVGEGREAIERYYDLALRSATRTGEQLPALDYYRTIVDAFGPEDRCRVVFAEHEARAVAALLLFRDKGAAHFAAGVSDPERLAWRVNDFVHWAAIRLARQWGDRCYRLGPIFPELPRDWPVARVSRFKKKFGGRAVPIVQGSFYLRPDRYAGAAAAEARTLCGLPKAALSGAEAPRSTRSSEGFDHVLRCYGVPHVVGAPGVLVNALGEAPTVVVVTDPSVAESVGLHVQREQGGERYQEAGRRWRSFGRRPPVYRALLPHLTFTGDALEPIWVNAAGRAVIASHTGPAGPRLLVGLDVEEEIVRYRQGDPERVENVATKSRFGFATERVNYLYDGQVTADHPTTPWADHLGFLVAGAWARLTGCPLVEPLPGGAKAAVALTGDDDQAYLETYAEQRALVGDLPFMYFLHPLTKHTAETLRSLGPGVELGLHPDALERPDDYDAVCGEQAAWIEGLTGRRARVVRNHSYLSRGYLGHLDAWEKLGLDLDVNCSAIDGTALTGSFLPMRARRLDRTWSQHRTLLTQFGDGMVFALGMSDERAGRRVLRLARQIERAVPAVVVLNLHPQNIAGTRHLHRAAIALARRPGWVALGLDGYLAWLEGRDSLVLERVGSRAIVSSKRPVTGIVLRVPTRTGWRRQALDLSPGSAEVALDITSDDRAALGAGMAAWTR